MSSFLVAIPIYNERSHVVSVVEEVQHYCPDILLVDDGSTDGTTDVIRTMSGVQTIFHGQNIGYGQALISAFEHAARGAYDWLITMDCDEQHEPSFIPQFMKAAEVGDADIISGSRYLWVDGGSSRPPADRRRINQKITGLLNELLDLQLTDAFCGFKAYRCAALTRLSITERGYAMPLQLWVQAVDRGLRIREIPVRLIYNDPDRHFGGKLDDPSYRLQHYLAVLDAELKQARKLDRPTRGTLFSAMVCP